VAIQARRERDRERQAKHRARAPSRHVTLGGVTTRDEPSKKEIPPVPPKENTSPQTPTGSTPQGVVQAGSDREHHESNTSDGELVVQRAASGRNCPPSGGQPAEGPNLPTGRQGMVDAGPRPHANVWSETRAARRGRRLSEDWVPPQTCNAEAERLGLSSRHLSEITEEFRNYWLAEAGARARKLDWDRTFLNRLRDQAHRFRDRRSSPPPRTNTRLGAILESERDAARGATIHIPGI
jgi:hypothetical protein